MKHYNYIFSGAGLAALMSVYRMAVSGKFASKSILLIDENQKNLNDRTWCFWERPKGEFDRIVTKKWHYANFADKNYSRMLKLEPYEYKMIRGIDFYNFVFEEIRKHPNIQFLQDKVIAFADSGSQVLVTTVTEKVTGDKLFNSVLDKQPVINQTEYPLLQQHFIGWFIQSKEPVFSANEATFMDFSVPQDGNTRFMYVLPFSENSALVEYTLFSKDLLQKEEYETAIKTYLQNLDISSYEITEKEQGNIPMTSYKFWRHNTTNIMNIGSAGGWTKASTGYTFKNTIKKSAALTDFLATKSDFTTFYKTNKFWFYDLLLLDILAKKNELGNTIFSAMFKKGDPAVIYKFLDEETTLWEDLQVIWRCPKRLFINALFQRIFW